MSKKQQFSAANLTNVYFLGKEIVEKTPGEILYEKSILETKKQKDRNELINELKDELTNAQVLYSSISELKRIRYYLYKNKTPSESKKYIEEMILKHAKNVGEIQAIKDLQKGLSILNKNRRNSPIQSKNILEEDGIYGEKTLNALNDVCRNYSLNIIKDYILKGIINNIIFNTKNNQNVDTKKLINKTMANLKGY